MGLFFLTPIQFSLSNVVGFNEWMGTKVLRTNVDTDEDMWEKMRLVNGYRFMSVLVIFQQCHSEDRNGGLHTV